jgi:hypothetical protein
MYRRQPEVPRSTSRLSRRTAACAVVGVVALLGAARPVDNRAGNGNAANSGAAGSFKYDIKMTVTTVKAGTGQSTRAYDEGLAHAQVANGKARIDVAKGPIGVFDTPEFLIIHDSTTLLFDPGHMQYAQVDPVKMMQGVGGVMGGLNAMVGIQTANVKIVEEALGPGDQLGPNATIKYRITEDYTINLNLMGMASSMTAHTSTDYWYPKSAMALINPFVPKGTSPTTLPTSLGADYAQQMTAAQGKLPAGIPLKSVANKVIADGNGNRTTTTTTWELLSIIAAPVPDAVFAIPTGYTQMTGPDMMAAATGGAASGTTTAGATGAATTGTGSTTAGKTGSGGVGTAAAGAATGVASGAANSAAQGAQSTINQAASDAAASTVKKILHLP